MVDRAEDDLRLTMETIHRDAERIADLEEEKANLDVTDPRIVTISDQVQRVAAELKDLAGAERELAEDAQASA